MSSVKFNHHVWSYQDYADYLQAVQDGAFERAWDILQPTIIMWSLEFDPASDDAYEQFDFEQFIDVLSAVGQTLEKYADGLNPKECDVDLKKWKMTDFERFMTAVNSNRVEEAEDLMKQVAKPKDETYDPVERLSFEHGALMAKAIRAQRERLFRKR